jgi:hypothetical protein
LGHGLAGYTYILEKFTPRIVMTSNFRMDNPSGWAKSTVRLLQAVCVSSFFVAQAVAAPVVNGNEISWPDDGWYQVQDTADYSSVCEGGRSCTVEPGTYVVINHSTIQPGNGSGQSW